MLNFVLWFINNLLKVLLVSWFINHVLKVLKLSWFMNNDLKVLRFSWFTKHCISWDLPEQRISRENQLLNENSYPFSTSLTTHSESFLDSVMHVTNTAVLSKVRSLRNCLISYLRVVYILT